MQKLSFEVYLSNDTQFNFALGELDTRAHTAWRIASKFKGSTFLLFSKLPRSNSPLKFLLHIRNDRINFYTMLRGQHVGKEQIGWKQVGRNG